MPEAAFAAALARFGPDPMALAEAFGTSPLAVMRRLAGVATLQAARALFPNSCTEFNATRAAWSAVSVPAQAGEPTC